MRNSALALALRSRKLLRFRYPRFWLWLAGCVATSGVIFVNILQKQIEGSYRRTNTVVPLHGLHCHGRLCTVSTHALHYQELILQPMWWEGNKNITFSLHETPPNVQAVPALD